MNGRVASRPGACAAVVPLRTRTGPLRSARRRVRGAPRPDPDLGVQRQAVDALLAAARNGDFEALLEVLAPDVVVRFDLGPDREPRPTLVGAKVVAGHVLQTAPRFVAYARPAIVNGTAGLLFGTREEPIAVLGFTVSEGRIAELDMASDPAKLGHLANVVEPGFHHVRRW
jgi:hypothetical protein